MLVCLSSTSECHLAVLPAAMQSCNYAYIHHINNQSSPINDEPITPVPLYAAAKALLSCLYASPEWYLSPCFLLLCIYAFRHWSIPSAMWSSILTRITIFSELGRDRFYLWKSGWRLLACLSSLPSSNKGSMTDQQQQLVHIKVQDGKNNNAIRYIWCDAVSIDIGVKGDKTDGEIAYTHCIWATGE